MNASPSLGLAQNTAQRVCFVSLRLHTTIPLCRSCRSWRCCVAHALTVRAHFQASAAAPQVCGASAPWVIQRGVVCLTHCQCGVGPAASQLRSRACRPANQSQLGRARCPARSARARLGAGIRVATAHAGTTVHLLPAAHVPNMQQRCGHCGGVQLLPSSLDTHPPVASPVPQPSGTPHQQLDV